MKTKLEELSFEEAMGNLEKVVADLESGNLSLDESVKRFEEGMNLSKHCNQILEKAEKQINILVENDQGEMVEEPFDTKD